jgi:hypothetical protein
MKRAVRQHTVIGGHSGMRCFRCLILQWPGTCRVAGLSRVCAPRQGDAGRLYAHKAQHIAAQLQACSLCACPDSPPPLPPASAQVLEVLRAMMGRSPKLAVALATGGITQPLLDALWVSGTHR